MGHLRDHPDGGPQRLPRPGLLAAAEPLLPHGEATLNRAAVNLQTGCLETVEAVGLEAVLETMNLEDVLGTVKLETVEQSEG